MIRAQWQTALFAAAGLGVLALHLATRPDLAAQALMLAPLVALFGLPHGALDLPIAEALWPLDSAGRKLGFVAAYLGLAGAVVAVWTVVPGVALALFLGYSALHFSGDWGPDRGQQRWAGGGATIGAPALLHHADVTALFARLAPPDAAALVADAAALTGGVALAGLVLSGLRARGTAFVEQALLWITAAALPPLMYFAAYFCALHSVRHFDATLRAVPDARRALAVAVALSVLVSLAALGAYLAGAAAPHFDPTDRILRIVFIGLAALTVPHMILVDRFAHRV